VNLARAALELLERLFLEFPEPSELALAHLQSAKCYESLGNWAKALEHLELSLDAQTKYPNSDSGVFLEYPWFVARHNLSDCYARALESLQKAHLAFPVTAFKAAATRAFIAKAQRDSAAAQYAIEALRAAALKQSQFQSHRDLGLVGKEFAPFVKRLNEIAAAR